MRFRRHIDALASGTAPHYFDLRRTNSRYRKPKRAQGEAAESADFAPCAVRIAGNPVTVLLLTSHAQTRLQQRAITIDQVMTIMDFGREQRAHGASRFFLDKGARIRLAYAQPDAFRELGPLDIQVVLGNDGRLITAARRTKRIRRDIQRTYRASNYQ